MTGLLIEELVFRGVLQKVLIITPGGLTKQWVEDELQEKFGLQARLVNRASFEESQWGRQGEEVAGGVVLIGEGPSSRKRYSRTSCPSPASEAASPGALASILGRSNEDQPVVAGHRGDPWVSFPGRRNWRRLSLRKGQV